MGFKGVGDAAQECGARFAAGLRVACEGLMGYSYGALQFLRCGGAKDRLDRLAGLRSKCLEAGAIARAALRAYEGSSCEFHDNSSVSRADLAEVRKGYCFPIHAPRTGLGWGTLVRADGSIFTAGLSTHCARSR